MSEEESWQSYLRGLPESDEDDAQVSPSWIRDYWCDLRSAVPGIPLPQAGPAAPSCDDDDAARGSRFSFEWCKGKPGENWFFAQIELFADGSLDWFWTRGPLTCGGNALPHRGSLPVVFLSVLQEVFPA